MQKIQLSWQEFENDMLDFCSQIEKFIHEKHIQKSETLLLIPCRGGEIIGSLLKNFLKFSESQVLRIKFSNHFYETWNRGIIIADEKENKKFLALNSWNFENILIIDDLIDSWDTFDFIREKISEKNVIFSALYTKEWKNRDRLDIGGKSLSDAWIVFPWEKFYEK